MKERPILFSGPMVRAILAGSKTQTRRIMKHPPRKVMVGGVVPALAVPKRRGDESWLWPNAREQVLAMCPHGAPGDRLWVREAWRIGSWDDGCGFWLDYCDGPRKERLETDEDTAYRYIKQIREDLERKNIQPTNGTMYEWEPGESPLRWRPSIHMPRWASRITLEITGVRVERLGDITEADAMNEGVERTVTGDGWRHYHADPSFEAVGLHPMPDARKSFLTLWNSLHGHGAWTENPWVWEFRRLP